MAFDQGINSDPLGSTTALGDQAQNTTPAPSTSKDDPSTSVAASSTPVDTSGQTQEANDTANQYLGRIMGQGVGSSGVGGGASAPVLQPPSESSPQQSSGGGGSGGGIGGIIGTLAPAIMGLFGL